MKAEQTVSFMKIVRRSKKRVGRGHGSGKVKTSGRGTKGQNARGHVSIGFEGGQLALIKRLPLLRGKGRNKTMSAETIPVDVSALNALPEGTSVTLATLKKYHMIDPAVSRVKILGNGKVMVKLTISVPCSASAKQVIEKAGGVINTSGSHE